jgi:glycosyltransferase involved in cell wall biosynthesis
MDPSKVVHMTSVHAALDGRIFHKECRSLARAGFCVTAIGPHSEDAVVDGVNIRSIQREKSRLARMTRSVWRIYREALRQNAKVYHFHDPELIPVGLLLRLAGKEVIYDLHEDYPKDILAKDYLPAWSRRSVAWCVERIEMAACAHFSGLVAVTPSIAARFRHINNHTVVVHNFPYSDEVVSQDQSCLCKNRQQSVAYVGGITAYRGIREMVAAMGLLPPSLGATLELLGPTVPGDVALEEFRNDPGWERVRYRGVLDLRGTFRTLHTVRAGLVLFHPMPNALESLPQKLFEYMGAGLPVIASNFPLWRQIVEDSGCGIVVDPLDPRAIARAIEYVLAHVEEAEEMGRRGQAAVLDRYNWNLQAEKLVNLYSDLIKRSCAA